MCHSPKPKNPRWRRPPSWIFRLCKLHHSGVLIVWYFQLCTKFGSNICYSHLDRHAYASDFHLMTSCELTSGFDFWSGGHLRMAVMHLPIKFNTDIFIQSKVIDIFFRNSRWRQPPSWIFMLCEFGHSGVLIVWYLCSVPNWVQISVTVTEIDALILQKFIWWRHAN